MFILRFIYIAYSLSASIFLWEQIAKPRYSIVYTQEANQKDVDEFKAASKALNDFIVGPYVYGEFNSATSRNFDFYGRPTFLVDSVVGLSMKSLFVVVASIKFREKKSVGHKEGNICCFPCTCFLNKKSTIFDPQNCLSISFSYAVHFVH